ncbi:pterin-4-alpha-carbinolamine dehydratase [Candidatus Kaiserbacteria bacterium RIFCSPHIGHO2_01_FULL_48_10]|uniref:Putative pterin-4-alpha-carbinolamine dehydratase n=1 Tax=Candidatus Kaiserbacteria bacterium RIFCSPHIGHO2_01_FULL_48_10 TaxID=1798476 RepID=A0A1F6C1Y9_9BACT|nr:MAG: pterin-4-alpha-carbinolamine dehydratase [Candidatus Kaiserbacteria bacterium RIFCSPHIGHO2_01_FULL_48_10]
MTDLSAKRCVPCEGGTKPLNSEQCAVFSVQVPEWRIGEDGLSISRNFRFNDFKEAIAFVNEVADIAEFEGHHPDMLVYGYRNVKVTLSTHAIKGLSENDFIVAAKIDQIGK